MAMAVVPQVALAARFPGSRGATGSDVVSARLACGASSACMDILARGQALPSARAAVVRAMIRSISAAIQRRGPEREIGDMFTDTHLSSIRCHRVAEHSNAGRGAGRCSR